MSGPSTPHSNAQAQPKQMSSRLLTMKFMQRASSTNTRPTPNRTSSTSQPNTPHSEHAPKRQKTDHMPDSSNPTTPATEPRTYASHSDIKAAIQAESAFEALARAKRAELGFGHNEYESEWVLNVSLPNTTTTTTTTTNGQNDAESGSESEEETTGRQTYGDYKRRKKNATTASSTPASKTNTPAQSHKFDDFDSDNSDDSSDGELDSDDDMDISGYGSGKKRKANQIDEADETAMSALDRVDLSKTGYAKAKKATSGGGGGGGKNWGDLSKAMEKGTEKKGKFQARGTRGKKLGRKR